ncbi:hypothetical protein [Stenotrophomonas sepilia]|uniref:hypothetical protein n=1 Tax=Stenotrophomonas sepilia TaxID=2860290 RepID=UPI002E7A384A|nr:hypothetical protein [Stenotrophomonas sepilia]
MLARLARLRPQVDAFFDGVMVNAEDPALPEHRRRMSIGVIADIVDDAGILIGRLRQSTPCGVF